MQVISVIVPIYNAERWLAATINDLASQTYRNLELILVDDGSHDQTVSVIRALLSKGFPYPWRLVELGTNKGPSAARNAGLRLATGSWVQFLDSDDFIAPNKLALQMEHCLSAGPDLVALYSAWQRCYVVDEKIVTAGELSRPRAPSREPLTCYVGIDRPLLGSGLVRRSALEAVGGFNENLRFWECEEILARLARIGSLAAAPSHVPLYLWRMPPDTPYIGDETARYQSVPVALGWMRLVLEQASGRRLQDLALTAEEKASLLNDCTIWARILYSRDRAAFRKFVALAQQLDANIAPAHPVIARIVSRVAGYQAAEGVARLGRAPRGFANRVLKALNIPRGLSALDWR